MTTKLNQLLAIEKGVRTRVEREITDLHKRTQKATLYEGKYAAYQPFAEDGEKQPDQVHRLQHTVEEDLADVARLMSRMLDVVASKDKTNTETRATVQVGDIVLMKDVPVSFLLYMEKQFNDLETLVRNLPELPADKEWSWDPTKGQFVTKAVKTYRTGKAPRVIVKYAATTEHPAQTEIYNDTPQIGEWTTVFQHGGLPVDRKKEILARVVRVKEAVKTAREEANAVPVIDVRFADKMFDYLWGSNN